MKLTDDHFQTFVEQGFVVVEDFYPEERRAQIAAGHPPDSPPLGSNRRRSARKAAINGRLSLRRYVLQ